MLGTEDRMMHKTTMELCFTNCDGSTAKTLPETHLKGVLKFTDAQVHDLVFTSNYKLN